MAHESESAKLPAEHEDNGPESGERAKEGGREWKSFSELLTKSGEALVTVNAALDRERDLARQVREFGGKVTLDTARKILNLEAQAKRLEEVIDKTSGFMDDTGAEEGMTLTPTDFKEITADPDAFEITDDMIVEMQPEMDLKVLEAKLVDETERAQEQIIKVATQINGLRKPPAVKMPGSLGPDEQGKFINDMRQQTIGVLENHRNDLLGKLAEKPAEVADDAHPFDKNAAKMQQELYAKHQQELPKLEDQLEQLKLEQEIQDSADEQIGAQMEAKAALDAEAAATEAAFKNALVNNPRVLDSLPKRPEAAKWTEEVNNEMLIGVLESQIGDLQNYVRIMGQKLKGVREDLGLQRGRKKSNEEDGPEMRKFSDYH